MRRPAPHVVADVTVTFGAAKPCLLLPPAARAAGRVVEVDLGLGPHLPAVPAVERLEAADAGAAVAGAGPGRRQVLAAASSGWWPDRAAYTGAAVLACARRAALGGRHGPLRRAGAGRRPGPAALAGGRGRRRAGAGLGARQRGRPEGRRRAGRGDRARAGRAGCPCVLDAGALELLACTVTRSGRCSARRSCSPRTPGSWPGCSAVRAARHRSGSARPTSRRGPLRSRPAGAASVTGRDGPAQGVDHAGRHAGRAGAAAQADGPAWLATAGAGDVLAGIAGTLLAAGLDPLDAGSLGGAGARSGRDAGVSGRAGDRAGRRVGRTRGGRGLLPGSGGPSGFRDTDPDEHVEPSLVAGPGRSGRSCCLCCACRPCCLGLGRARRRPCCLGLGRPCRPCCLGRDGRRAAGRWVAARRPARLRGRRPRRDPAQHRRAAGTRRATPQ